MTSLSPFNSTTFFSPLGSCGGCYVFTSDPVESYESAEEKIAVSKGGLNKSTLPRGHKAILSC